MWNERWRQNSAELAGLMLCIGLFFVPATTTLACSCYRDDGEQTSVNATEECKDACGDADAIESDDGTCACPNTGESIPLDCASVCESHGYLSEPPTSDTTPPASETYENFRFQTPQLAVPIPGLTFTPAIKSTSQISVNFIGEYVSAFYTYLVGIAATIAIVFVMIGGLQYVLAAGTGDTAKAKARIRNAVAGLMLILFTFVILYTVNPNLVYFEPLTLLVIEEIKLDSATDGDEGVGAISISYNQMDARCKDMIDDAQADGVCNLSQGFNSPTGDPPLCSNHHWGSDGAQWNWQGMKNLDFPGTWDTEFHAPFSGLVSYKKRSSADNKCGNTITLTGEGVTIYVCHAKDFTDESGTFAGARTVTQGEVLGHIGGNCCAGETPPPNWSAASRGWCDVPGTTCADPEQRENCDCQSAAQAGNTSGPHVHVTWTNRGAGDMLACLNTE